MKNFYRCEDLIQWFRNSSMTSAQKRNLVYLIDFEMNQQKMTGLELIRYLGIENQSIIVSSHFYDGKLESEAEKFGIRLIPKNLASYVDIKIEKEL